MGCAITLGLVKDYFGGWSLANHKSAAKRARQTIRRSQRNSQTRSAVRTLEKKLADAINANNKKDSESLLITFMSKIDKAAQKGVYKAQAASRRIARMSSRVAGLK